MGMWLAENTAPDALIVANEAALIGYHAMPRPILDLDGRLMPVERDRFLMIRHAPDVVVLREGESVGWENFATTYAQVQRVGTLSVYQRVVNWSALDDHGVDVNLSARFNRADMRLVKVGIGRELRRGDLVRVRLDWQLAFAPRQTVEIKLNLLGAMASRWRGSLSACRLRCGGRAVSALITPCCSRLTPPRASCGCSWAWISTRQASPTCKSRLCAACPSLYVELS